MSLRSAPDSALDLTNDWGSRESVELYLDRCQVDTPDSVVRLVWKLVHGRRDKIRKVIDFGAGDGRFASHGRYKEYLGYEIDPSRRVIARMPKGARVLHKCA